MSNRPPLNIAALVTEFWGQLQIAQDDRLLVWVREAIADYPILRSYIFLPPEQLLGFLGMLAPQILANIDNARRARICAKLAALQTRLAQPRKEIER